MIEIIPAIDIIGGKCVRLSQGDYGRMTDYNSLPSDMVSRFLDHGLGRIHAVDLEGAKAGRPMNLRSLEAMASFGDAAIEWGGGIKCSDDLRCALDCGARYIVIGSIAVKQPQLFSEWLAKYGADTMVLGADARNGKVAVSGWLDDTAVTLDEIVSKFSAEGLSQAIVTDISRDGMLQGPSFDLYRQLQAKFPSVIFTVSGGISSIDDIKRLEEIGLRRVIVGKALYEGRVTLKEIEHFIVDHSC